MNVYDEQHNEEREFWSDEPTGRIARPTVSLQTVSLRAERLGADPFIARIGLLVTAGLIAIALVWAVKVTVGGDSAAPSIDSSVAALVPVTGPPPTTAAPAIDTAVVSTVPATADTVAADVATAVPQALVAPSADQPAVVPVAQAASSGVAAVPAAVPTCRTNTYTIKRGDAWILIARKVKVTTKELLAANGATARTPIFPGRTVCLPAHATLPTVAPASPKPAAAASAPKTAAPKTTTPKIVVAQQPAAAPKATVAQVPAATVPTAPRSYTQAESVAIIRQIWPDELEEKAIAIAWRESNHQHTARNYCCHGLFQMYFNVHKGWLTDLGVTTAAHLYDPTINARAALTLYMRAGGWGPWGR